jgi:hypothetical protein
MKHLLTISLIMVGLTSLAQNQISAPTGQSLKIVTDTVLVGGHMRINSGMLKLNNYRFLSTVGTNNTFIGASGNLTMTANNNTLVGAKSGAAITTGGSNNFFGVSSGNATTTGISNVFIGSSSGLMNTAGKFNTFIGNGSGTANTTGEYNVMVGNETGSNASTGSYNTLVGRSAGVANGTQNYNTLIGYGAGGSTIGSSNVFIGALSGKNETGSNKLHIANSNVGNPLIYGDFAAARLVFYGKTGINTGNFPTSVTVSGSPVNTSTYQLFVKGGILTEDVVVATGWADYVFEDGYRLKPLSEVAAYIKSNGHLPNVPSAKDIEQYGANLGHLMKVQQEKIEELTLYAIDQQKQVEANSDLLKKQQKQIDEIKALIKSLK